MRRFIEPSKPILSGEGILDMIDDSYIVDCKYDGWRSIVSKDNDGIHVVSRKNKKLDIPSPIIEQLWQIMPIGHTIDCEWINKPRIKSLNKQHQTSIDEVDCLCVFDVIRICGECFNSPLHERRKCSFYKSLPSSNISDNAIIRVPSVRGSEARAFYKKQINNPLSEGVVIKNKQGLLYAKWYKVKHR